MAHSCTFGCDNYCPAVQCTNCGELNEPWYQHCGGCSVELDEDNVVGDRGKDLKEENPIDLVPLVKNVLRSVAIKEAMTLAAQRNIPMYPAQLHGKNKWDVLDKDPVYLAERNPYSAWLCLSPAKVSQMVAPVDAEDMPEVKKARRWHEADDNRPTWDEFFMQMALLAKKRSTCASRHVGAVIVVDNNVVSIGYNGSASNMPHCINEGCLLENGKCVRSVHAEQNALIQAAKKGTATEGATLYSTWRPCAVCSKLLPAAGIKRVVFLEGDMDKATEELFRANNIAWERIIL